MSIINRVGGGLVCGQIPKPVTALWILKSCMPNY